MESLYHRDVFVPDWLIASTETVEVNYGAHARKEAFQDRYGVIELPAKIDLSTFEAIEFGVIDGVISKILYRGILDEYRDLCIVLIPGRWFAKTVWVNWWNDTHRTLDASKYQTS